MHGTAALFSGATASVPQAAPEAELASHRCSVAVVFPALPKLPAPPKRMQGAPEFAPRRLLVLFDSEANSTELPGLTLVRWVNLTIEFNTTSGRRLVGVRCGG